MKIIPAIDIQDKKVVRLIQGKFDQVTEYSKDPIEMAKHWEAEGAEWLHIVDLDGAKTGQLANFDTIKEIKENTNIKIEVGGGIGSETIIGLLLDQIGIDRIILGTNIFQQEQPGSVDEKHLVPIIKKWGPKIAVSIDCLNGFVAIRGWTDTTTVRGVDLSKQLEQLGIETIIYTDISRDGMLSGPNLEGLAQMLNTIDISVIASGGIASIEDIQKLLDLNAENLIGAITGKAIYEGKLDLKEAVQLCSQNG